MRWGYISFNDLTKVIVIIYLVIYIMFVLFFRTRETTFSCAEPYKYCTATSTNMLKFKTTKNIIMAYEITDISVEKYKQSSARRRRYGDRYRYKLLAIKNSGQKVKIMDGFFVRSYAEKTGEKFLTCLKNKAYPCVIKN